jgi:hypothetical protein
VSVATPQWLADDLSQVLISLKQRHAVREVELGVQLNGHYMDLARRPPKTNDPSGLSVGLSSQMENVLRELPAEGATIDWLLSHLLTRSPEMIFLTLTPIAIVPATSPFAGALLFAVALPLVLRRDGLRMPHFLAAKKIRAARVERVFKASAALLKRYETYALRRPHPPARHHTRLVGALVLMLSAMLLVPLPFSNVLPGFTVGTVALYGGVVVAGAGR